MKALEININTIIEELLKEYNIGENRVVRVTLEHGGVSYKMSRKEKILVTYKEDKE